MPLEPGYVSEGDPNKGLRALLAFAQKLAEAMQEANRPGLLDVQEVVERMAPLPPKREESDDFGVDIPSV